MQRREFCKLVAAAAAANAIAGKAQTAAGAPSGFNTLRQTYEEFCATPEKDRVFYALVDGKIVETKLEDSSWAPTDWGKPPELPGGSWDGVPMTAPIAGSAARARTRQIGIRCSTMTRRSGTGTPSSVFGHTGARSVCQKMAIGMRATCMRRALPNYDYQNEALRTSIRIWLQGPVRAVDAAQLGT